MSNQLSSSELAEKMREGKILRHPKFKFGQQVYFICSGTIALGTIHFIYWANKNWCYNISGFSNDIEEKELQEFTDTTILFLP
jgi:hypothetical protein